MDPPSILITPSLIIFTAVDIIVYTQTLHPIIIERSTPPSIVTT
ncbi:hypothetical protein MGWOODY_Clf144 [hydrothermal vent metagenome]|uniref:Uncharacterized protein n=1 Tax=hydrothermal vent metagenome TaxID=652676 RepID=A0A160VCF0_9ZZZZ